MRVRLLRHRIWDCEAAQRAGGVYGVQALPGAAPAGQGDTQLV